MIQRRIAIQEAGQIVGKSPKTLRRLEAAGLIPAPARDRNNCRVYTEEDIRRILAVLYPHEAAAENAEAAS